MRLFERVLYFLAFLQLLLQLGFLKETIKVVENVAEFLVQPVPLHLEALLQFCILIQTWLVAVCDGVRFTLFPVILSANLSAAGWIYQTYCQNFFHKD